MPRSALRIIYISSLEYRTSRVSGRAQWSAGPSFQRQTADSNSMLDCGLGSLPENVESGTALAATPLLGGTIKSRGQNQRAEHEAGGGF